MFTIDSSFCQYKVYADIRGEFSKVFIKISIRPTYTCVPVYAILIILQITKNSDTMTKAIQIARGGLFQRAELIVETE